MALNDPRTQLYAFKIFEANGVVHLFDDSTRDYLCSAEACIWVEPIYWVDGECENVLPETGYWSARKVARLVVLTVPLHDDDIGIGVPEEMAWDAAREEAHANHQL